MQQRMSSAVSATCYCTGSAEMGRTACAQMYHTLSQINHQWTLHVQTCSVWRGKWSQHQLSQLTHTHTQPFYCSSVTGTTQASRYQKGKTRKVKSNLDLLEQDIVSGSGFFWAICKSASHPRQPRQHPTTHFLQAGCPSCCPTNSVKALKSAMEDQIVTTCAKDVK